MKIGIVSDLHIGFNDDAAIQAEEALSKLFGACDLIIIPGDLFDSRIQKYETLDDALKLFGKFQGKGNAKLKLFDSEGNFIGERASKILAIPGTHERRTKGLVNAVQLFDSAGMMVNVHNQVAVFEKSGSNGNVERLAVQGICGMPEEVFVALLRQLKFKPLENHFNVFIFHQALKEAMAFGEFASIRDLPEGFDLYVDGHMHLRKDFGVVDGKRALIVGSTVVTQMKRNEVEKKGYWIFDTLTKEAEFFEINSRPFYYFELEFQNAVLPEVVERVKEKVSEIKKSHSFGMAKFKLYGTLAKGLEKKDLQFSQLVENWQQENFKVSIDLEFSSEDLKEKIEFLRNLKQEKASVKEAGFEILKQKLIAANFSLDAYALFELLSEGEVDKAVESLGFIP